MRIIFPKLPKETKKFLPNTPIRSKGNPMPSPRLKNSRLPSNWLPCVVTYKRAPARGALVHGVANKALRMPNTKAELRVPLFCLAILFCRYKLNLLGILILRVSMQSKANIINRQDISNKVTGCWKNPWDSMPKWANMNPMMV